MDQISKFDDLKQRQPTRVMLDQVLSVGFMKMIIAMKGEAYSGKTTCAEAIAAAYNCSVISFDHILDSLSGSGGDEESLVELAFDIVLRMVRLQMKNGRPVVIDSPLTKQTHLDKLVAVADEFQFCKNPECDKLHCRFVVVECIPKSRYTWERRFEEDRSNPAYEHKWYKPKKWNDVVSELSELSQTKLPSYACKLTVDTTYFVPDNYRNLGPATLDICMCPKGHLLDFRDWLPHRPFHTGFNPVYAISIISGRTGLSEDSASFNDGPPVASADCREDGRHMLEKVTSAEGLERCSACHIDISYPNEEAYACTRCKLVLHKTCAELKEKSTIPEPRTNLPDYLQVLSSPDEFYRSIPDEYRRKYKCSSCTEFSVYCSSCLWEMHLESRVIPTSVLHEGHNCGDPVWFWVTSAYNPRKYRCDACKLPGSCVGYTCLKGTFKVNFHVECALLPRPVSHEHGGHHHEMQLVFGTYEEKEDYLCDVCQNLILDPAAWYYYCPECVYVCHLNCIYEKDQ